MTEPIDDPAPPWHLLPHSPWQFFGLGPTATRDDLKLAYSRLVRRFKPDKFPDEFKRIRAAYEQVDRRLASGVSGDDAFAFLSSDQRETGNFPVENSSPPYSSWFSRRHASSRDSIIQSITTRDPVAVYAELAVQVDKTPFQYYVLAVLSDVINCPSKRFVDWITEGVASHPMDTDLVRLFQEMFSSTEHPADELGGILLKVAKSCPSRLYYYLTAPLWRRYVKMVPWATFEAKMEACERALDVEDIAARVAFAVGLMHRAMWHAPIEWLQAKKRWIEESQVGISGNLEFDHELNCRILMLRERFIPRLQHGAFGKRILESIIAFCEENERDAAAKITECQRVIAEHPEEFLSEFDFQAEEPTQWCQAWQWICWIILSKLPTQEAPSDDTKVTATIAREMRRFNLRFPWSIRMNVMLRSLIGILFYGVLAVTACFLLVVVASMVWINAFGVNSSAGVILPIVAMLIGVAASVACLRNGQSRWNARVIEPYVRRRIIPQYQQKWRLRIAHSMQFLLRPYSAYLDVIPQLCLRNRNGHLWPSTWLTPLMTHDLGLILYSAAVPFRR
jgi:hypothetical protein